LKFDLTKIKTEQIGEIEINMLYHSGELIGQFEVYEAMPQSIIVDNDAQTLKFRVYRKYPVRGDEFEIVIQQKDDDFVFKSDFYEDTTAQYELFLYSSDDDYVFYQIDEGEEIYMHVAIE